MTVEGAGGKKELRFDLMTGLLVSERSTREGPMGSVPVTINYSDYQAVKGLQFPMVAEQIAGGQSMTIQYSRIELDPKLDANAFKID